MIDIINDISNKAISVHIDQYPVEINNSREEFDDLVRSANIDIVNKVFLTKKKQEDWGKVLYW